MCSFGRSSHKNMFFSSGDNCSERRQTNDAPCVDSGEPVDKATVSARGTSGRRSAISDRHERSDAVGIAGRAVRKVCL